MNPELAYDWLAPKLSTQDRKVLDIIFNAQRTNGHELSRLRDLVREMREALGETRSYLVISGAPNPFGILRIIDKKIHKADAILKKRGEPVKYGCHYCMDNNQPHDSCLLDTKEDECYYARDLRILRKNKCGHWRPIK